jgi:hypothetical protein
VLVGEPQPQRKPRVAAGSVEVPGLVGEVCGMLERASHVLRRRHAI